jgi:hypothetical protein
METGLQTGALPRPLRAEAHEGEAHEYACNETFPLAEAADALRYLVEGRPFGRVILAI